VIMEQSLNRDLERKPEEIRKQIYANANANATSSTTNLTRSHSILKSRRRDHCRKPASKGYGLTTERISRSGNNFLSYVLF